MIPTMNKSKDFIRMLKNDWQRSYRYLGGLTSLFRCSVGTWRIMKGDFSSIGASNPAVDCITFSIVPQMTALWALLINQAIVSRPLRVIIGDCSGILKRYHHYQRISS